MVHVSRGIKDGTGGGAHIPPNENLEEEPQFNGRGPGFAATAAKMKGLRIPPL